MPTRNERRGLLAACVLMVVFALAAVVVPWFLPSAVGSHMLGWNLVFAALMLLSGAIQVVTMKRSERRWAALRPMVWDAMGCVCPWCRIRVDGTPCVRHGLSKADQPVLLDYWQSLAKRDLGGAARAQGVLLRNAHARGGGAALVRRAFNVISSVVLAQRDPTLTRWQRVRAALIVVGFVFISLIAVAVAVRLLLPRRIALAITSGVLSGCWPWFIMIPAIAVIGPAVLLGPLKCTACGQQCADGTPTRCPECGADLTRPAAVTRRQAIGPRKIGVMLGVFGLIVLAPFVSAPLVALLPISMRTAVWTATGPPHGFWQKLTPATMPQSEIDTAAALLISCAEPEGPRPLFDFDFIPNARTAGKLSDAMYESAARAIVQASLTVEQGSDGAVAVVRPEFGANIVGKASTPRLVFGGVSVDGGPWSQGARWSLFEHDLDDFWRAHGQLPVLPAEQLEFRAPLGTSFGTQATGPHTVRARCWIVLHDYAWVRYEPTFNAAGELEPPTGATVYELMLETKVP